MCWNYKIIRILWQKEVKSGSVSVFRCFNNANLCLYTQFEWLRHNETTFPFRWRRPPFYGRETPRNESHPCGDAVRGLNFYGDRLLHSIESRDFINLGPLFKGFRASLTAPTNGIHFPELDPQSWRVRGTYP